MPPLLSIIHRHSAHKNYISGFDTLKKYTKEKGNGNKYLYDLQKRRFPPFDWIKQKLSVYGFLLRPVTKLKICISPKSPVRCP